MPVLNWFVPGLLLTVCSISGLAQQPAPDAAAIMAKVAANQDKAEDARTRYTYVQHAHVVSRKGKTVMCEETTDARITPSSKGYAAKLLKLDGRLLAKGKYLSYTQQLPAKKSDDSKVEADHDSVTIEVAGDDTDRDLVENMRQGLTSDNSKDGINQRLFPLSTKGQEDYRFQLIGRERMNGCDVFHIVFRPKDKNDFGWKGDAYIDTVDYQPVVVSTDMARKVPLAVRTLLGTNVPGLGFIITYAPQPEGVWFPVTLGTEFKLHVLFFFSREILISVQNRDFEKTHVTSRIIPAEEAGAPR